MELFVELFTNRTLFISDFYEIHNVLIINGSEITETSACDIFKFSGCILGGKRIAATGRKKEYDYSNLTGIFEAEPAKPYKITFLDPEDKIYLKINTNIFLDPGLLTDELSIKVFSEKNFYFAKLTEPFIKFDWPKRGEYYLDITELVKELYARR